MNVLLIKTPLKRDTYSSLNKIAPKYPPLGLCYIAAVLEKAGYNVKIVDLDVEDYSIERLLHLISNFNPGVIGLTATTPAIVSAYSICLELKKSFKDIPLILGGVHATALPNEALEYADIVVRGEGEHTFLELTNLIKSNKLKDAWKKIDGLSFKHKKQLIHTPDRRLIQNLDELPLPARHLIDLRKYHYFGSQDKRMTNIFTSRGCPFKCTFCNKNIFGHTYRILSAERVVEEIDNLVIDFGIKEIHISDDAFNTNKERVKQIFQLLQQRKYDLTFFPDGGVRVNSINREMLDLYKKVGFATMVFGVESGDQGILNRIQKGITIDQIKLAFKMAKQFSFETWGYFILGLPGETRESAQKTIDLAIKLNPDIAKFAMFVPYPGTKAYLELKERIICKDWSKFGLWADPVFEPENISKETLQKLYRLAFRKFYLRPESIANQIKRLVKNPRTLFETYRAAKAVLNLKMAF